MEVLVCSTRRNPACDAEIPFGTIRLNLVSDTRNKRHLAGCCCTGRRDDPRMSMGIACAIANIPDLFAIISVFPEADLTPDLMPGLILVHGNHPESLRDLLSAWIRRYTMAPL